MLTITLIAIGSSIVTFVGGYWIGKRGKDIKMLPAPKDPMESRIYPYLLLLDSDPDGWRSKGTSWQGWERLRHKTGKMVSIYKTDGDVETDVYSRFKLTKKEKQQLRSAVFKLKSLRSLNDLVGV